jgi:hypothetical protein
VVAVSAVIIPRDVRPDDGSPKAYKADFKTMRARRLEGHRLKRRRGKTLFDGPLVTAGTAPEGNEHLPSVRGQFERCAVVLTLWTGVRLLRRWDICGIDHNKRIFSMEADCILSFAIKSEGAGC